MVKTTDQVATPKRKRPEPRSTSLNGLEQRVEQVVMGSDWRRRFHESPGIFLVAAALGGGLLVALATHGRKVPPVRVINGEAAPVRATGGHDLAFEAVKGALIGVAVSQAKGVLSQLLAGFARHWAEGHRKPSPSGEHV